jgi:hypothetical protein
MGKKYVPLITKSFDPARMQIVQSGTDKEDRLGQPRGTTKTQPLLR